MSLAVALLTSGAIAAIPGPPSFSSPPQLTFSQPAREFRPASPVPQARRIEPPTSACDPAALQQAAQQSPVQLKRLGDLPPAAMHFAVVRKVAGCDVATIRFEGKTYWVPYNPQAGGGVTPLLAGAAVQR